MDWCGDRNVCEEILLSVVLLCSSRIDSSPSSSRANLIVSLLNCVCFLQTIPLVLCAASLTALLELIGLISTNLPVRPPSRLVLHLLPTTKKENENRSYPSITQPANHTYLPQTF